jgi:hypothetical protein
VKKKKYLAWLFAGDVNEMLDTHRSIIKKFSENFEKLYIINFYHLKIFYNFDYKKKESMNNLNKEFILPKNIELFFPKTTREFKNFMTGKELVGINSLGRRLEDFKINFILSKYKIKQIQISNIGFFNLGVSVEKKFIKKNMLKIIFFYINKKFGQKLTLILSNLKLMSKIEIRFISNLNIIESINNNFFKKFFYKLKLFYAKELIVINSRAFEYLKNNTQKISEDKIILLEPMVNHPEQVAMRGLWNKNKTNKHYNYLNSLLKKMSQFYKKEVVVCIHPKDNLEEKKSLFSNFRVVQFETQKNIYDAFLVIFFDTTAIIDAIYLKKNIITLYSDLIGDNFKKMGKSFADRVGFYTMNVDQNFDDIKITLLKELNEKKNYYTEYINTYIAPDNDKSGSSKIITILKERYFLN